MKNNISMLLKGVCLFGLLVAVYTVSAQEINWYSVDNGGGVSSGGDITVVGVVGQTDVMRMEGGSVTVSSGYLPLPADLIFENMFD